MAFSFVSCSLYLVTLLNLLIISRRFIYIFLRIFYIENYVFLDEDSFTYSFPTSTPLISFSCLIALAGTYNPY